MWPCAGKTVRPRSAGAARNANFELRRRVLCGPAQGKQSGQDPRERLREMQILSSGDAFCVALPRENSPTKCFAQATANFELPRCIFCGPAQAKRKFDFRRCIFCPDEVDSPGVRIG